MKKQILLASLAAFAALSLAGCEKFIRGMGEPEDQAAPAETPAPEAAPEAAPAAAEDDKPVYIQATSEEAVIDWAAARADVASHSSEDSDGNFRVASEGDAPPVPVMLPSGIVLPAGTESDVKFQNLSDGYFAFYPGADYNIIVNGTNEVIGERAPGVTDTPMRFIPTMSGAQVAFTRYGADYLIEFECSGAEGARVEACITEDEAMSVAESLVPVRSR